MLADVSAALSRVTPEAALIVAAVIAPVLVVNISYWSRRRHMTCQQRAIADEIYATTCIYGKGAWLRERNCEALGHDSRSA